MASRRRCSSSRSRRRDRQSQQPRLPRVRVPGGSADERREPRRVSIAGRRGEGRVSQGRRLPVSPDSLRSRVQMAENKLFYGDNLDVLRRYIKDESVDLVYLDPPFNSNADYNVLFAEQDG